MTTFTSDVSSNQGSDLVREQQPVRRQEQRADPRPPAYCADDVDALTAVARPGGGAGPRCVPDARTTSVRRWSATIGLVGMGRTGVLLAHALACAGIGGIKVDDPRLVDAADAGLGGHHVDDVGARRATAAAARLRAEYSSTEITVGNVGACDLVVLASAHVTNPTGTARLICEGVPHLSLTHGPARAEVGPLVVPGRTACLNCVDLHRVDHDPGWRETWRTLRRASVTERTPQPALLTIAAASHAAAMVLEAVDGGWLERGEEAGRRSARGTWAMSSARSVSTTLLPDLTTVRDEWDVHPGCGCTDMAPLAATLPADGTAPPQVQSTAAPPPGTPSRAA